MASLNRTMAAGFRLEGSHTLEVNHAQLLRQIPGHKVFPVHALHSVKGGYRNLPDTVALPHEKGPVLYATQVWFGGQRRPAVTNVGVRPTVKDNDGRVTVDQP